MLTEHLLLENQVPQDVQPPSVTTAASLQVAGLSTHDRPATRTREGARVRAHTLLVNRWGHEPLSGKPQAPATQP